MKHYQDGMESELKILVDDLWSAKQAKSRRGESSKKKGKVEYVNLPCSIDIETTSTVVNNDPFAFAYAWAIAFGVGRSHIYYGRNLYELQEALAIVCEAFELGEDRRLVMYAHNLGFEFQFIRRYISWSGIRAKSQYHPMIAEAKCGLIFKDSQVLAGGASLEIVAKNLVKHKIPKLVGQLDYSLVRHPETPLTQAELDYLENDVRIVCAYIDEQIDLYQKVENIPWTNTGRVRRDMKDRCLRRRFKGKDGKTHFDKKNDKYRQRMALLKTTPEEHLAMKKTFMGGFTHANPSYVGIVLEDVASYDFTSSYPAVMLSEKFPMSRPMTVVVESWGDILRLKKDYALRLEVVFNGIRSKIKHESYMSESKCTNLKGATINNGRVVSADVMQVCITDVDLDIMVEAYHWDSIDLVEATRYIKGYLPKEMILAILVYYRDKTTLKGVEGMEVEYMIKKGMLNSLYGMCVTDIIKDGVEYFDNEWKVVECDVNLQVDAYNDDKDRFLYYPWGVWITAYARRNLWTGILEAGDDYVYSDTDSLKLLNHEKHAEYFARYDETIKAKMIEMCDEYRIDPTELCPMGKWIGVWDHEGVYKRFKTLGAKRYLVQTNDNQLEITVAGLPKKAGVNYLKEHAKVGDVFDPQDDEQILNAFDLFNDNMHVGTEESGKLTHLYTDVVKVGVVKDYLGQYMEVTSTSSIHLDKAEYNLSLSDSFKSFLRDFSDGKVQSCYIN